MEIFNDLPVSLNFGSSYPHILSLKIGNIMSAEVLDILNSDTIILGVKDGSINKVKITASLDSPLSLSKGDLLRLKVTALGQEIRLQVLDITKKVEENPLLKIISTYLSEISSKINKEDIRTSIDFLKKVPEDIKVKIPEFSNFEKALPEIETLSSKMLEFAIKNSGLFFENKIRIFLDKMDLKKEIDSDIKGLLLRLKDVLKNNQFSSLFLASEINTKELLSSIEGFLKIIEFYQFSSFLNNVLYTYLPLSWLDLKDREIVFKKREDESYLCEIRLDIECFGRLNISISYQNKSLYISFYSEDKNILSMINANIKELEKRFEDSNLLLKAINIIEKERHDFDLKDKEGVCFKV